MPSDEALDRYRQDEFFDHDVVSCTGLSARSWRELIKLGVVRTASQARGRGHVRSCDRTAFKRVAVIAALHSSGLSLAVAGYVAHALPYHTLLFEIVDPDLALRRGADPRVKRVVSKWFDPKRPARADPANDWLIEIYCRRFVGAIYAASDSPMIFGDLRNDAATFVAWWPMIRRPRFNVVTTRVLEASPPGIVQIAEQWEDPRPWRVELEQLGYFVERHDRADDLLRQEAEDLVQTSFVRTSVNVSLAIRIAVRRCLGLDPPAPVIPRALP